jgi:hypothetical protein
MAARGLEPLRSRVRVDLMQLRGFLRATQEDLVELFSLETDGFSGALSVIQLRPFEGSTRSCRDGGAVRVSGPALVGLDLVSSELICSRSGRLVPLVRLDPQCSPRERTCFGRSGS